MSMPMSPLKPTSTASRGDRPVRPVGWAITEGSDWITASAPSDWPWLHTDESAADLLRQNSKFPARLKWHLDGCGGSALLRLDLIAAEEESSPYLSAAEAALAGSAEAGSWFRSGSTAGSPPWAEWISEAGWETRVAASDDGVHLVYLDLPGAPPARLEADARGDGVELRFDYPRTIQPSDGDPADPAAADARAHLLLRLGGVFRLIVPALADDGVFYLRLSLPGLTDSARLRAALPALHLAVKDSLGEFEALADPGIAKSYLNTFASPIGGPITTIQT